MILHLILNSLIVFVWLTLIVEFCLFLFKVKNARVRYICRSLPFLKIPFDILIFMLYGDSLFINLNPLSCQIFVHELISKFLPAQMNLISSSNEHLIIPQYIAMQMPAFYVNCLTVVVIFIAAGGVIRKIYQLISSRRYLKHVLKTATPYSYIISNECLRKHIHGLNAMILVSPEIEIPCAADPRYILLPQNMLDELSREEVEAVIAHELQHLKWKDPLFKFFYSLVCALCWWIPTTWWLKRVIAEQEQASDAGIYHYGIDNCALATAVTKILSKAKNGKCDSTALCFLGSSKSTHIDRLKYILNTQELFTSQRYMPKGIVATIVCLLAFMSLWMC